MKTILLCGANGFIGRNILERFARKENYKIRATYFNSSPLLRYSNVDWVHADLRDPVDVRSVMHSVDIVLQYAATTTGAKDIVSKPYIHVTDNVVMNSLLLREAFEQHTEHFIMPSCTIMYRSSETPLQETDFNESDDIFPKYYGAGHTKVYLEKMCKFYSDFGRTKHTVLRQSNIYGPHDKYDLEKSHVFGATITKVMTAEEKIEVWGTGEEQRDFLHVDDLLDLIEAAIEKQETNYELMNAGYGSSISIGNLVKTIVKVSERNLDINYDTSKPTINTKIAISNNHAYNILKWKPKCTLEEGVKNTIDWYNLNKPIG